MPITIEQARDAKQGIGAELLAKLPVVGIGLVKHGADYAVKINLAREPIDMDLPTSWDGVPLMFEVAGPIRPRF